MKAIVATLASAFLALPGVAQGADLTFTSYGTGSAVARPDMVLVRIGFSSEGETPQQTIEANAALAAKATEALSKAGVQSRDLQTANYVISEVQGPDGCGQYRENVPLVPCEIVGYEIRNTMTLRIRELDRYGAILGAAIEAGLSDISGITLALADSKPYEDKAYVEALKSARNKAALTASTLGFTLGRIVNVGANFERGPSESGPATLADGIVEDWSECGGGCADMGVDMTIQPGELTFNRGASITYEILQTP